MKASEVTVEEVKKYLRIDNEDDDTNFDAILDAAKAYVKGQTGLNDEQIDIHEDISIAILVLCSEMYENRTMTVDKSNVNKVIESIIEMHSVNLL